MFNRSTSYYYCGTSMVYEDAIESVIGVVNNYFKHLVVRMMWLKDENEVIEESFKTQLDDIQDKFQEQMVEIDHGSEVSYMRWHIDGLKDQLRRFTIYINAEIDAFLKSMDYHSEDIRRISRVSLDENTKSMLHRLPDFVVKPVDEVLPTMVGIVDSRGIFRPKQASFFNCLYEVMRRDWFEFGYYTGISEFKLRDPEAIYMDESVTKGMRLCMDRGEYEHVDNKIKYLYNN